MLDKVEIAVKAGNGGDGIVSFRREKFVPYGGPDGGDGGDGGSISIQADRNVTSLRLFKHKRLFRAGSGENGRGKKMHGRNGEDLVISVPVGTMVLDRNQAGNENLVADLEHDDQLVVVAKGGEGGLGNTRFASSTNQTPKLAQRGESGEEKSITLELRLIADVGIIGYPNAGKSTLLTWASAAKPKIADYPFTTIEPALGVAEVGRKQVVLAEIPGLIDGAHLGRGLGHDFLRHVTRTRVIIHLVDGTSESPVEDMVKVNTELGLFDSALAEKPQIVAVNKIDLPQARARSAEVEDVFRGVGVKARFISAVTGEGVPSLLEEAAGLLKPEVVKAEKPLKLPKKIFRPQPVDTRVSVHLEGDTFVVVAPDVERLVAGSDISNMEVRGQLRSRLDRQGLRQALVKAGIKPGDKVRCGALEWEW